MENNNSYQIPILFCFFNRQDNALQVFESIRKARPAKLYLHSDGPRNSKEQSIVLDLRNLILQMIDWQCEVHSFFREMNLGCTEAVRGAILWLLEHEEWGVILEDDCVPSQSFYPFCAENLEKYKNVNNVLHIGGYASTSAVEYLKIKNYSYSYAFTGVMECWGWATWRRAYEYKPNDFKWSVWGNLGLIFDRFLPKVMMFRNYFSQSKMTWAWAWSYSIVKRKGICICPTNNLVLNVGLVSSRENRVVDSSNWRVNTIVSDIKFPLKHPKEIQVDRELGCHLVDTKEWFQDLPKRALRKIVRAVSLVTKIC